eukprot:INCI6800.1.p1 GENE.INCI6800.1~~INCI6800.1.p1  ORF type:complete len:1386 (+),score=235.40 INCI6800.1:180-4337(+)
MRGLAGIVCLAVCAAPGLARPHVDSGESGPGMFQQNGRTIEKFADTNTMEDYVHSEPDVWQNKETRAVPHLRNGRDSQPQAAAAAAAASAKELNIFVLPHSHDDPGWVRTSDQYFDFFVNDIYTTAVEALTADPRRKFQAVEMIYFSKWYDGATPTQQAQAQALVANGQLQFAVGGWAMPDEATTDYPDIIETMTTGHQWLLDTFGDAARPRFGFQVDPFGASSAFAALSALMGFNGHIVARLNYFDKGWMQDNKQLEFVWRPDADLYAARGADAEIFTHIMDQYQYSSPGIPLQAQLDNLCALSNQTDCPGGGFFWDGDDSSPAWWWSEQQRLQGYSVYPAVNTSNVQFYSDFMVNSSRQRAEWFRSPNLLWCFGTDFQWFNASEMFFSMDQIVDYITARNGPGQRYENVTIQYGMLDDYFSAVHSWAENNAAESLPTHSDTAHAHDELPATDSFNATAAAWSVRDDGDFLPYNTLNCAGASQDFQATCSGNAGPQYNVSWPQTWSGFFTSHMGLKVSMRRKSEQLRASKALLATAAWSKASRDLTEGARFSADAWHSPSRLQHAITGLRSAVGLLTHHDSQTGTMGPGCGNGDTAAARQTITNSIWSASDAASTPNFQMSLEDAIKLVNERSTSSETGSDSATCPFLPMGDAGNAGAIDADYEFRLEEGWRELAPIVSQAAHDLLTSGTSATGSNTSAPSLEMDASSLRARLLETGSGTVTVFNPLGWTLHRWVPISVPEGKYSVSCGSDPVLFDMMPAGALDCATSHRGVCAAAQKRRQPTPGNIRAQSADDESQVADVVMYVRVAVPPLGLQTLTLNYLGHEPIAYTVNQFSTNEDISATSKRYITNAFVTVAFDTNTNSLLFIRDRTTTAKLGRVKMTQSLHEYESFSAWDNYTSSDGWSLGYTGARSGSYLLHTSSATPGAITDAYSKPTLDIVVSQAGYIKEARQSLSPTATQVWRLYGGHATDPDLEPMATAFVDYNLAVGPLGGNREHITLFNASLSIDTTRGSAGSTFMTDNNGLLMQERTYSASRSLPDGSVAHVAPDDTYELALNYYPIVRSASIQTVWMESPAPKKLTILSAQAGAVTSRSQGALEVMVMRKSLQDDSKGACQVFNDTTGQYATIPNDPSLGDTCQGYANMGTCRPDGCPDYAIPMNISERVETRFLLLAGAASDVAGREQVQAQVLNNPPLIFYGLASANDALAQAQSVNFPAKVAPLGDGRALPESVHLLNLGVRVNTSGAPNVDGSGGGSSYTTPQLVLRVQNIADATATLRFGGSGLCKLFGAGAEVEERSLSTIWPLSGKGALTRWPWDTTVERSDDEVDLNRLNRAPSQNVHHAKKPKSKKHNASSSVFETSSCSRTVLELAKRDLRTFYVSPEPH